MKEGMGWGGRRCAGKAGRENRRGEGEGEELPVRPRTRVTLTSLTGTLLESMAVNVLCVDVRCCLRAVGWCVCVCKGCWLWDAVGAEEEEIEILA